MKNQLFTRNALLGILMALVLAFGVQGIADALTLSRPSNSGDLQTIYPGDTFTIRFSVGLTGSRDIYNTATPRRQVSEDTSKLIDSSGYELEALVVGSTTRYYRKASNDRIVDNSGYVIHKDATDKTIPIDDGQGNIIRTYTIKTGDRDRNSDGDLIKAPPNTPLTDSLQHHYNDEAIGIVASDTNIPSLKRSNIEVTRVTDVSQRLSSPPTTTGTDYSLADKTQNRDLPSHKTLSSLITLTGRVSNTPGVYTITIADITHPADFPSAPSQDNLTFTIYVVKRTGTVSGATTSFDTTPDDGVEYGYNDEDPQLNNADTDDTGVSYFDFSVDNAPVYYSVEGSGRLYVKTAADRMTTPTSPLLTSSAAPVYLKMNSSTNKVTAHVAGNPGKTAIFIFSGPTLNKVPRLEVTAGNNQVGVTGGRLEDYLEVKVTDGNGRAVPGVAVEFADGSTITDSRFIAVPGTKVYAQNPTVTPFSTSISSTPLPAETMYVQTDSSGLAKVYYQFGATASTTPGDIKITASLAGHSHPYISKEFSATGTTDSRTASLVILSGDSQSGTKGSQLENPLVVLARSTAGYRIPNVVIQFRSIAGTFRPSIGTQQPSIDDDATNLEPGKLPVGTPPRNNPRDGQQIYVITGANGEASVEYNVGQTVVARDVIAEVRFESAQTAYDFAVDRVTFKINGGGNTTQPAQPAQPTTPSLTISTDGEGATRSVTVTASDGVAVGVTLDGTALPTSRVVIAGTATTITLPTTPGTYTLTAAASGYTSAPSTNVTVPAPQATGTLAITTVGARSGTQQQIRVTASGRTIPSGGLVVTLHGVTNPPTVTIPSGSTSASRIATLPSASSAHTVSASATGYNNSPSITIAAPGQTTTTPTTGTTPTTTPTTTTPEPSRIEISGPPTRSGSVNEEIEAPLLVRVLDDEGEGVEDTRVIFRVQNGQGRLSQRGNGRAVAVETDSNGYARADYTPMSARSTVEASVRGVSQPVTFTITATGGAPATTTPATTTPAPADVTLKVGAAKRPVMYWITGGALYRQATGDATQIAASAKDVVVDTAGGKLYWIEQQTVRTGAIHSANLDGSNAKVVKTLTSAPMGLALDTANKKLYLTNGWGKIQRMNLDGSRFETNFITQLTDPRHVAVSDGNVYWTEAGGSVRAASLTGAKTSRNIATGTGTLTGIAAGDGKVFWTEQTGTNRGKVASANPDGTGVSVVYAVTASVYGLATDPANNRLYWTNGWGKVQRGLSNGKYQDVATGLSTPTAIAIGGANMATDATPAKPSTPKTAANKYDVNGDGAVDSKDVDTLLLAVLAELTAAKYDVNGDGAVDAKDVRDVNKNLDNGAAGAPTLLGMKFSALEVDRLQEQIDLLVATDDRSPAAMRTLIYLQQLLVMARPEKTQLLANYPNPFNPETWIPYELATDTEVTLTIYNAQGVVIRVLHLGQQSAGYYTDRERAAYWDGRNALGEQVASGIYFYQLQTDEMSSLRKMVILK